MSWPVAAYGLLALALAGGFAWYERSRPDARIVALVGTLAAFAALGRIAFAAVPNVKPTTDIVLVAGYALGGAPGFVVGAVAALASNFFFGQGPWTPWQMVGWGATGLIGAGLAVLTRGRLHRIPLAGVCFVVGFGFTVLQDVGDWVTYSDHGLAALGAYVGQGLGFDLIHAIGCAGFALAFGPALIHSLSRFRLRLTVTWVCRGAAILVGGWGLAQGWVSSGPAEVGVAQAAALPAGTPAHYLLAAQNADGGFGAAPGQASESLFSGWAALGLAADGVDPATTRRAGGRTLLAYLEAHSGRDTGSLERSILALAVARGPVAALAGELSRRVRADGSLAGQTNLTAFAILALRAGGLRVPARMVAWLARQQDPDGGFNFATAGGASDVDDTGAVLEALAGAGRAAATRRAVRFLEARENRDGGFPSSPGGSSNAQSTAFAVQGLLARHHAAPRALGYLRRLTAPDGHVAYAAGANQTPVWVTAQAMLALAGRPLPLAALPPPTVAAVPVARKPPARRAALRQAARPRRSHGLAAAPRPAPDLGALAGAAGALAALALAPVGDP